MGLPKDFLSKLVPGACWRTAVMITTSTQTAFLSVLLRQAPERPGNTGCGRGAALLIRHYGKMIPFPGQPQHGFYKVMSVGTKDPAGAHDDMTGTTGRQCLFPGQLAGSIHSSRPGRIGFPIGRLGIPCKYIIRGDVEDRNALSFGHLPQMQGPVAVYGI